MRRRLLIVAGEVSGDIHAANMLRELLRLAPEIEAFGVGGERLRDQPFDVVVRTEELAVMGLAEVLKELPRLRGCFRRVVEAAEIRRPDLAVLVDSPDFNLRLAQRLHRLGIPVILYVSPQLWAWRQGRVKQIRRVADEVLCILPFEVPFYAEHGVEARYVGHPLVDDLAEDGLLGGVHEVGPRRLALLPGSRSMEIRALLPTMLQAVAVLPPEVADEVLLIEAPGVESAIDEVLAAERVGGRIQRVRGRDRRRRLASCAMAWTASGTATLECALLDVPMVVGYRLQTLTYQLARLLVSVDHVALVNLIARRALAPELIQHEWSPERLVAITEDLMNGPGLAELRRGLAEVRNRLGAPGASRSAAEAVLERLHE